MVAPAGCGKTELIAQTVALNGRGADLVLTHTNAGVAALSERLKRYGVTAAIVEVRTIAAWALRLVTAYPSAASVVLRDLDPPDDWDGVYRAATRLLRLRSFAKIFRARYSGVFVDEYQDCNIHQHTLVCRMRDLLPCVVLGDPLQTIMNIRNDVPDWTTVIERAFPKIGELTEPWRWKEHNPGLGEWLLEIRSSLLNSEPVDFEAANSRGVMSWRPSSGAETRQRISAACRKFVQKEGTTMLIRCYEPQCVAAAKAYPGFEILEAAELADLRAIASALAQAEIPSVAICEWVLKVVAHVSTTVGPIKQHLTKGTHPKADTHWRPLFDTLAQVDATRPNTVLRALEAIRSYRPKKGQRPRLLRPDLWFSLESTCKWAHSCRESLAEAAVSVIRRRRQRGRGIPRLAIGRPRLVKGLQFDHVFVFDAQHFSANELYVNLSRPTRWLGVTSDGPVVKAPR